MLVTDICGFHSLNAPMKDSQLTSHHGTPNLEDLFTKSLVSLQDTWVDLPSDWAKAQTILKSDWWGGKWEKVPRCQNHSTAGSFQFNVHLTDVCVSSYSGCSRNTWCYDNDSSCLGGWVVKARLTAPKEPRYREHCFRHDTSFAHIAELFHQPQEEPPKLRFHPIN